MSDAVCVCIRKNNEGSHCTVLSVAVYCKMLFILCAYKHIDKFVICSTFQIDVCFIIFWLWFIWTHACAHTRTQTNTIIYPILNGSWWILAAFRYGIILMKIHTHLHTSVMVCSLTCIHIVYCLRNLLHLIYRPSTTNQY